VFVGAGTVVLVLGVGPGVAPTGRLGEVAAVDGRLDVGDGDADREVDLVGAELVEVAVGFDDFVGVGVITGTTVTVGGALLGSGRTSR
jgi:hypothetical protein